MKVFTVHTRPRSAAADADAVTVKEGFCWPAALFSFAWALWHGMWLVGLLLLAVDVALGAAILAIGADPLSAAALGIGWSAAVGYLANDLRRRSLARRGFVESAVVAADDRASAEYRYFRSAESFRPSSPA